MRTQQSNEHNASNHSTESDEIEKRRLRNRLSQQAFRRRQKESLRELRNQAQSKDKPEIETISILREENSRLRKELLDVQSKLSRYISSMETLTGSITTSLEGSSDHGEKAESATEPEGIESEPSDSPKEQLAISTQEEIPELDLNVLNGMNVFGFGNNRNLLERTTTMDYGNNFYPDSSNDETSLMKTEKASLDVGATLNTLSPSLSDIWTFEYQMGPQSYANSISVCQDSSILLGKPWTVTNSPFSDHIGALQNLLKRQMEHIRPLAEGSTYLFYNQILMILSLFNSISRPDAMAWYAKTRFYHIVHLTAWQILPCTKTFRKVHRKYKPTSLQLRTEYPRVIDWIPFPTIRDRLIRFHAANPRIDQIFCDTVSSYVVEALMSDLVMDAPAATCYIRVTDVIANLASTTPSNEFNMAVLPAPDVATLFSTPEYCQAVFTKLGMDAGTLRYKMDPAFFGKYPELFDSDATDISAEGIPLTPEKQNVLSYPSPLDSTTFQTYRSFIDFSLYSQQSLAEFFGRSSFTIGY